MRKMKRIAALVLALMLSLSLAVPAYAAETDMEARLQAVTLKAKQTLGIGDNYDNFTGSLTEGDPTPQWNLNWSNSDESIQVGITEAGKVLQYYRYQNSSTPSDRDGSLSKFPSMAADQAETIANAFLAKVLTSGVETTDLTSNGNQLSLYKTNFYFQGTLLVNGISTPVNLSLSVDADTKSVISFYRSDAGQDYSSLTKPGQAISPADASKTLFGSVSMVLNYAVRQSDDANGQKIAYPQYTPVQIGNQAVDALNGKLIDITPSYSPYPLRYGVKESQDAATTAAGGLTETELKTASELKDTLSKSVLESKARAISELGLTSAYTLNSVNYYAQQDGDDTSRVIASLSFSVDSSSSQNSAIQTTSGVAKIVQPGSYTNVTLDAKQGTLLSVSSYRGYDSYKPTVSYTRSQAETIARAFAGKMQSAKLASTVLADSDNDTPDSELTEQLFVFHRTANGIPFPQDAITISVDTVTGAIASYQVSWEDDMQFASADHLISADQAADLYTKAVGAVLSYVTLAEAKDGALTLAYVFTPDSTVWGVDAASGDLLKDDSSDSETLSYTDIAGSYAKAAIEKLAGYGIGFSDGKFQPGKSLTQEDLLTLLVAAGGGSIIYPMASGSDDSQEQDTLYQQAYSMGLLTKDERQPSKLLSRAELVKLLINGAGYGKPAQLTGIYKLPFKDASSIPAKLYGYVAIAYGLGIISGDSRGYCNPNRTATRAEAALMLSNYMSK